MLVTTKLHMPPLRARMVDRTRLFDKLSGTEKSRLILIAGPAGSGKTSLACQWIRKKRLSAVWYSLDRTDNEGDLFFRYLLTGFADKHESFAEALRPFLPRRTRNSLGSPSILPWLPAASTRENSRSQRRS